MGRSWMMAMALACALAGCGRREHRSEKWNVSRGLVSFLARGKRQISKGAIRDVRGTFEIDFADITKTRGTISMDLASLAMTSFEEAKENEKQTTDAFHWLDAETYRSLTFAIRTITWAEPRDLTGDAGSPRRVRARATGDLTLHGRTAAHEVELEATVAFEGSVAKSMFVQTIRDLAVDLSAHGLRSSDEERVPESVEVALQLAAEPAPR